MPLDSRGPGPAKDEASLDGECVDVLIEGSDLPQVISAACLASLGYTVLLLEPTENYGGFANGPLPADLLFPDHELSEAEKQRLGPLQILEKGGYGISEARELVQTSTFRFHLELQPRFYFAVDALLDVLVGSGAASYLFFQPVDTFFWLQISSENSASPVCISVPCTKSAISRSTDLRLAEKRWLMRSLRSCLVLATRARGDDPLNPALDVSDEERCRILERWSSLGDSASLLEQIHRDSPRPKSSDEWRLPAALLHDIYAWGIEDSPVSAVSWQEGVERVARFLWSVLRFQSNTPFLCCKHGSTEIIQALARRCAVKGGTIALQRRVMRLAERNFNPQNNSERSPLIAITNCEENIQCNLALVTPVSSTSVTDSERPIVRFVGIRKSPLCHHEPAQGDRVTTGHAFLVVRFTEDSARIGPPDAPAALYIWQMSATAGVCPPDHFLVYAEADFSASQSECGSVQGSITRTTEWTSLRHTFASALRCLMAEASPAEADDAALLRQLFVAYAFYAIPSPPSSISVHTRMGSTQVPLSYSFARTDGIIRASRQILMGVLGDDADQKPILDAFFGSMTE
jgi:hypothetical protein